MPEQTYPLALDATPAGDGLPQGMPPVFDAHVHLMPDRLFRAIRSWFERYAWPIRYRPAAHQVLPFLRKRGLSGCLALPYAHKPGIARELNRAVAELCAVDEASCGFATVFPGEPECRVILEEGFALGLRGVKLHPHVQGFGAASSEVQEVCSICLAHHRPLMLHAGREPRTPLYDYAVDPHAICSAEYVKELLQNHPGLHLCVPHLGADEFTAYRKLLDRFETLWLDTAMAISGFLPTLAPPDLQTYPRERIIYGSDFPNIPYPWDRELKRLLDMRLPEADLQRILSLNAHDFLNPS